MADAGLALFAWVSPSYPVGAFAYSHGVECAIENGDVCDGATLEAWLADILVHGSGRNEAILFVAAWNALRTGEGSLADIAEHAVALASSRERRLETVQQGAGFIAATRAAWPNARFERAVESIGVNTAYSICFAAAAASHDMPLRPALDAFIAAFLSSLVSAAVRMATIGQTEGQSIVARLAPRVGTLCDEASRSTLEDLGGCAFRSDLAAMKHETLYSRLFRS